jgi:glutamate dehydrogenase
MAHALTALPHDLLVALKLDDLERVTLTAMSLTDRPRPKLIALRSPLGRHLYIFVWLPRDDVSTGIRKQIQNMLIDATGGSLLGWTIGLEDGGVALLRYTLDLVAKAAPQAAAAGEQQEQDEDLDKQIREAEKRAKAAVARVIDKAKFDQRVHGKQG